MICLTVGLKKEKFVRFYDFLFSFLLYMIFLVITFVPISRENFLNLTLAKVFFYKTGDFRVKMFSHHNTKIQYGTIKIVFFAPQDFEINCGQ